MDAGTVIIRLVADAKGVTAGFATAAGEAKGYASQVAAMGARAARVGRSMTKWVTIPVLAAGVAAVKFALDFQKSMTDVEALVGMSGKEVARFKEQILALAPAVGKAPKELGDAFYFIASSGLKGAAAMRALTASAKASAAGLGDTKVVADAVTSAINAYGEEMLSATRATDILVAAVREGKSEPEAFAGSIGRVIPLAAKMSVTFGEVSGIMAAMSLNGTDANEAVTQISAVLSATIKPTKDGAAALASIGMSYADLRKEIADKGLTGTISMLDKAFRGNIETLGELFPNIRALRGFLALTGPEAEKYAGIIRRVAAAQGDAARAFEVAAAKPGFKLKAAWAEVQASLIKVGDIIVPVLAQIAQKAAAAAKWFGGLSESTKTTIVQFALVAAVAGPVLVGIGKITKAILALRGAYLTLAGAQAAASLSGGVGAAAAGAGAGASMAGLAALVPAAAIAAGLAAAIVIGVNAGLKQAQANKAAQMGFWQDFWSTFKAVPKGMLSIGDWLYEVAGGGSADRFLASYSATMTKLRTMSQQAWGQEAARIKYLQADIVRAFRIPAVKAAMEIDTAKTKAQLTDIRNTIQTTLHVPLKEATRLTKLIFPGDWAKSFGSGAGKVGKDIADVQRQIAKLRADVAKRLAFGDINVGPALNRIKQLQDTLDGMKKAAAKAGKELGEVGTIVATGMDRSGGKVKVSAGKLVSFIQLPLGKAGPKFLSLGGDASGNFAKGIGKAVGKAAANATALANAAKKPAAAAVGAMSASGTNAAWGFARGVGNSAAVQQAAANAGRLAQAAIDAANATGEGASPWKTTMRSGVNMVRGFALGIKKGTREAIAAASEMAQNVLSVFDAALGIGAAIGTMKEQGLPTTAIAKKWATRVAKMVKAMYAAMRAELGKLNLLDRAKGDKTIPGAGSKFSAIATMVGDIGGIFSAFADLTPESIQRALGGIYLVRKNAKFIASEIVKMVKALRAEIGKYTVSEFAAGKAERVTGIAGNLADIISTFAGVTGEKGDAVDLAVAGIKAAEAKAGELGAAMKSLVDKVVTAITGSTATEKYATLTGDVTSVAGSLASTISTFAGLTVAGIDKAVAGLNYATTKAPELAGAMVTMVRALQTQLAGVIVDEAFTTLTTSVATIVGNVAGVINDLTSMTEKAIQDGIWGAGWVAYKAVDLGAALKSMMTQLSIALGGIGADSLTDLSAVLAQLREITDSIAGIVFSLASMTPEQLNLATAAGSSLGQGFYDGMRTWYQPTIDLARRFAADSAAALGGTNTGAATPAYAYAGAAPAGRAAPAQVVVHDNSRLVINLPPSISAAEARSIAHREIDAFEARKTAAKTAALRGSVSG